MTVRVAVSGKGGTGKTTFSALLVRILVEAGRQPVLAIDADPNSCLGLALGTKVCGTIGGIREELLREKDSLPPGLTKAQYIELKVRGAIAEEARYDLLVMGRPEGAGCYCYVNSVLRTFMDSLGEGYPYVVMDNEAGLEHLSRRTTNNIDVLFVMADRSRVAIESAARVRDLAREMRLNVGAVHLVVNRTQRAEDVAKVASEFGWSELETVPPDPEVDSAAIAGRGIFELATSSAAYQSVRAIARRWVPGL